METKYQTSFIPKKPVATVEQKKSSSGISLFMLISIILFLVSLGLAGYIFLQKNILIQNITSDQDTITKNKGNFTSDTNTIESLVELNSRINVAKVLLGQHIAVSPIFNFIQQATLKSVRFNDFTFTYVGKNSSGGNKISILMDGKARDWPTVASQADEFGLPDWKNIISEPKISNLSQNPDNTISFQFSAYVSPDFLLYSNSSANNSTN
jgi:hypothetical protein